ncbi:MAG: glutamine-hydrolyzing GMP synthase [Planctomycetia bacterium]|nr:glutamine-hydrolyzing GMP synthase [Planctomycetia bacterium]
MSITREKILVVDFGSKSAQLYARRIREQQVFCQMVGHEVTPRQIQDMAPVGLVFTDNPLGNRLDPAVLALGLPTLEGMTLDEDGNRKLSAFLKETCGCQCDWTMEKFAEYAIEEVRQQVGEGRVVCGLSGGVDSSVVAALIYKAIGNRLSCIFVDTGLMRKGEPESVTETFSKQFQTDLHAINAESLFLSRLAGVTDPQQKRKIIGATFIDCFAEEAKKLGDAPFLAQGTIYPDIIESGIPGCNAKVIKHHHNVGGLPDDLKFDLVEPLKDLFKDEVRQLGLTLGLPAEIVWRQPFPGPGLGVRCLGELTKAKLDLLREADAIVREELAKSEFAKTASQTFAVLLPVQSVGVRNGERTYENAIAIRSVQTTDFMTANWTRFPYDVLETMADRILSEVPGVNRVVYDISKKPSATIEWE